MQDPKFNVVVLAGERNPGADPLAKAAGTASKVLVPVGGQPVIDRAITAIEATDAFAARIIAGPPKPVVDSHAFLRSRIGSETWCWVEPASSPATTVVAALTGAAPPPTLVTTADHAFLSHTILRYFVGAAQAAQCDVAIGFARLEEVIARFPGTRRTGWRFSDDTYCGCNLFAFTTPRSVDLARLWQRFEADRKRPWRIMRSLGPGLLLRYLVRRLSLSEGLAELGRRADCRIAPIILPFPQAAVDVDSVDDWRFVNRVWDEVNASDP